MLKIGLVLILINYDGRLTGRDALTNCGFDLHEVGVQQKSGLKLFQRVYPSSRGSAPSLACSPNPTPDCSEQLTLLRAGPTPFPLGLPRPLIAAPTNRLPYFQYPTL